MPGAAFALADLARRLVAVDFRHLAIHENDVIVLRLDGEEDLEPVDGDVGLVAELAQVAEGDLAIHRVVLGEKDALLAQREDRRFLRGRFHRVGDAGTGGLAQRLHEAVEQGRLAHGLREAAGDVRGRDFRAGHRLADGREEDHPRVMQGGIVLDGLREGEAVGAGHLQVDECDGVGRFVLRGAA